MIETSSDVFARRARLYTAAIALALALTIAAVAAVMYSSKQERTLADYRVESPISQPRASASLEQQSAQ